MDTILCIDDDGGDFLLLKRALKKVGMCTIHNVKTIKDAEMYLCGEGRYSDRSHNALPAILLTNLAFLLTGGFKLLEWLRSKAEFAGIAILCVTGSDDPRKREEALKHGVECVSKSSSFAEVAERVRELAHC